jgi:recombination protein RecR
VRIRELVERVRGEKNKNFSPSLLDSAQAPIQRGEREGEEQLHITEIIFAFDPTIEGETTLNYLVRFLSPTGIRMTRLARGLPVGGDLEYADPITLSDALSGRRTVAILAAVPHRGPPPVNERTVSL